MKTASKIVSVCFAGFLIIAGVLFFLQHQALDRIGRENRLLKIANAQLAAEMEQWIAEKGRSREVKAAPKAMSPIPAAEPTRELLRLRDEVGRWRLLEREGKQLQQEQMQAAQTKLPHAEAAFEQVTKLHADKMVGTRELNQARFAVELLRAEAAGDGARAAQIRLREAEADLEHVSELHQQKMVGEAEYRKAQYAVDVRQAELRGDALEVRQIELRQAEAELAHAAELRQQSLISDGEYSKALLRVELLRGPPKRDGATP